MTQLLHLDASPRGSRSHSRALSAEVVAALTAVEPTSVVYRDLGHGGLPFIDEAWIAAAFSDPATHSPELQDAIRLSDELVDELLAADVVVIGTPMYNFGVPAVLKAYIDQIVRVGRTFSGEYQGLAVGKKVYVVSARGASGYRAGEAMAAMDYEAAYLHAVFGLIGITDVTVVDIENATGNEATVQASLADARRRIAELVATEQVEVEELIAA